MPDPIVERIVRESNIPDLLELLTERLSPTDLQSLLLAVYKQRAATLTPAALLQQYQQNRFVQPSQSDPRKIVELDRLALSLLPPDFEPIELSPVCPLGTNSVIATVDQNKVLTTIRNTEVCADSTNVLALECASRRKAALSQRDAPPIKLFASHRLLRAQVFGGAASFTHFRIQSLCTAGRDRGGYQFEIEALTEHLEFYLLLLQEAVKLRTPPSQITISLSAFDGTHRPVLQRTIIEILSLKYPTVTFQFDDARASGRGYYAGTAFRILITDAAGTEYDIVDGVLQIGPKSY